MIPLLLDGRLAASTLLESLRGQVAELNPHLVVVQVGEDPASSSYITQKIKSCQSVGMRSTHLHLSASISLDELLAHIDTLNADRDVTGFIVQLPLSPHLNPFVSTIIESIHFAKDVDGFNVQNMGNLMISKEHEILPPATPSGVITLLEHYQQPIAGKHAVIVGRSTIVGKPLALMLLNRDATVSVCHSKTADLASITRTADLLICAIGKPHFITAQHVKKGAVIIDVGINRITDATGKSILVGDTDFQAVLPLVSAITPVPGGVGPMTVASLIKNCVQSAKLARAQNKS